jgi:GNAT superfamily N-acetyltransferase
MAVHCLEKAMTRQTEFLDAALPSAAQLHAPARASARRSPGQSGEHHAATAQTRWVPIRHLAERHRSRVLQHLLALNDDDRLLRFGQVAGDAQIERYVAAMNFEHDEIFGIFGRSLRIVALAHLALSDTALPDASHQGELGLSVLASARGRGLGGHLFDRATVQARNRGATSMVIHLARHNTAMLHIVQKAGATVVFAGPDAIATLHLAGATWATQVGAALEQQAAEVDFQLKVQLKIHAHRLERWLPGH